MKRQAAELQALAKSIFMKEGATEANAELVARHLVETSLRGVDTHGVTVIAPYAGWVREGFIRPAVSPTVLQETPSSALISGGWGWGIVAADLGMRMAIEKARDHDIAIVGLVECHHIGRLGAYAEQAIESGMIGFVWVGGVGVEASRVAPFGGSRPWLSGNPIAIGFPANQHPPVVIDFSTMASIPGHIVAAAEAGQQLPPGILIDPEGRPTTDPNQWPGGSILPFGGHKGYGLLVALELMGRTLTGAESFFVPGANDPQFRHQGATLIAIRADLFQDMAQFTEGVDELGRLTNAVPPAPGFTEVMLPGEREARLRNERSAAGIEVSDATWAELMELLGSGAD